MIQFDIAEIIRKAEEDLLASSDGLFYYTYSRKNSPIALVEDMMINAVWKECINKLGNMCSDASLSLATERVVSRFIRMGVSRDIITYHNNVYRVPLGNIIYIIRRGPNGIAIKPFTIHSGQKDRFLSADVDSLVELMLQFDAAISEIKQASQRVYACYRKEEIENEIKEIVRENYARTSDPVMDSFIDNHLKPLGIYVWYVFHDDDNTVSIDLLRDGHTGHCVLLQDQYKQKLMDIDYLEGLFERPYTKTHITIL